MHDFVPAPCWDNVTGAFLDRCNPMKKNAAIIKKDKETAAPKIPPLVIPEEKNDRALPEGSAGAP